MDTIVLIELRLFINSGLVICSKSMGLNDIF